MSSYDLPQGLKDKIVDYCYKKMETLNQKFLKENNIRPCLYMEVMYDTAIKNMYEKGSYELDNTELQQIFVFAKNTESIMLGFIEGRNEIIGIKDEENLVFKVKRQIEL